MEILGSGDQLINNSSRDEDVQPLFPRSVNLGPVIRNYHYDPRSVLVPSQTLPLLSESPFCAFFQERGDSQGEILDLSRISLPFSRPPFVPCVPIPLNKTVIERLLKTLEDAGFTEDSDPTDKEEV